MTSLPIPWSFPGEDGRQRSPALSPLLADLEVSLPPSRAHSRAWYCWAGDPKQTADREPRDSLIIVLTCCMTSHLWFMAARQRRISFVASVFPEPLSPLTEYRARVSALLCLSTSTSTHEPHGIPEVPRALPVAHSRLSSHYLEVWMQTRYPRCLDLFPPQLGSPDDDTLVLFGIKHFGEGEISNCKEVPGETGHKILLSPTISFHSPNTTRGWGIGIFAQPSSQCCPPLTPKGEL